jgi:Ca2+:H+ antiporter
MRLPWWSWVWPVLALVVLSLHLFLHPGVWFAAIEVFVLIASVFAAVYHAEVVAHRIGEPFGTLVLAIAVTVIEVALIVSMMLTSGTDTAALARDAVFSAVMLACNGIIGLCMLTGALRHCKQGFQLEGANALLTVLIALTTLTLVIPNVTTSTPGPTFSRSQLVFASVISLVLYGSFLFVQTVRHRDYFLPPEGNGEETHAAPPSNRFALISGGLLLVSLILVVTLAKKLTPALESGIDAVNAPKSAVGVVIAALVLLPEGLAAYRAAKANRLQTSINLSLGSALASISLTIPVVAAVAILLNKPLTLGLNPKEEILLALTFVINILTLGTGRTTVLQGLVHLVLVAVFLFLAIVP